MCFQTIDDKLRGTKIRRLKRLAKETITDFNRVLECAKKENCVEDLILKHDFILVFMHDDILTDYLSALLKDNFISIDDIPKVLKNPDVIERIKRRLFNYFCAEFNELLIPYVIRDKYDVNITNESQFLNQYKKFCIRCSDYDTQLMKEVGGLIADSEDICDEGALYYEQTVHPKNFIDVDDDDLIGSSIVISSVDPLEFSAAGRTSPLVVIGDNVLTGSSSDHHQQIVDRFKRKKYKELTGEDLPQDLDEYMPVGYDGGYEEVLQLLRESNVGVGSIFGKVALLEFVSGLPDEIVEGQTEPNEGNMDQIANVLKAAGYKKVYINANGAWTSRKYLRIAKRLYKKVCEG